MKTVVFLNGPARSGKSTIANHLVGEYGYVEVRCAQPLRDAACAVFNIDESQVESWKQKKIGENHTGRDFMIGLAENIIKPMLGHTFFGVKAAQAIISSNDDRFVVSDIGFQSEFDACLHALRSEYGDDLHAELWYVCRPHHDFDVNDSRSKIQRKRIDKGLVRWIHNDRDKDALLSAIDYQIKNQ